MKNLNPGYLTPKRRDELMERRGYQCSGCGATFSPQELQIHHKNRDPFDDRAQNLRLVCPLCHGRLHGKSRI